MSLILRAPVPNIETTTVLPNSELNDSEALRLKPPSIHRAMDGSVRTYVKSNARSKLNYPLTLTRMKALELRAFIESYYRATIELTNHKDEIWHVVFTVNPFEFTATGRAEGQPGGEMVDVVLELEGTKVS